MHSLFDIYRAQFKSTLLMLLQYRAAILIQPLAHVLRPIIFLAVWAVIVEAQDGTVGGFTASTFAAYYLLVMLVHHANFAWDTESIGRPIRTGFLSAQLMRPIHPIHLSISEILAYKVMSFPTVLFGAVVAALAFHPTFQTQPLNLILAIPTLILAFLLNFMMAWTLGICAFWTTRMEAAGNIMWLMSMFLSGEVVPLALLPDGVRVVAEILPYRWTFAFPVELMRGALTETSALVGIFAQIGWLLIFIALHQRLWKMGIRRYSAVGG